MRFPSPRSFLRPLNRPARPDEDYNTKETPFEFTPESLLAIEDVLSKYPSNYPQSACIPVLWIAQKQHGGWLPLAAMDKTAEVCKMPSILVYEVATFYTMFNRCPPPSPLPSPRCAARPALTPVAAARRSKKIGKYNIQMCTTTPCMVMGAYDVLDTIKETLDCKIGGDTEDGLFHLMEVECLGACANAPMMQISHGGGDEYFVRSPPPSPALRRAPSHPRGACACRRT